MSSRYNVKGGDRDKSANVDEDQEKYCSPRSFRPTARYAPMLKELAVIYDCICVCVCVRVRE